MLFWWVTLQKFSKWEFCFMHSRNMCIEFSSQSRFSRRTLTILIACLVVDQIFFHVSGISKLFFAEKNYLRVPIYDTLGCIHFVWNESNLAKYKESKSKCIIHQFCFICFIRSTRLYTLSLVLKFYTTFSIYIYLIIICFHYSLFV